MKAKNPVILLNIGDKQRPELIMAKTERGQLVLKIRQNTTTNIDIEETARISFERAVTFIKIDTSVSDVDVLNIDYEESVEDRCLLCEYSESELADGWTMDLRAKIPFRHYEIWFRTQNVKYVVISENVLLK